MQNEETSYPGVETQAETLAAATPVRKRPKPGERRVQILQALAAMLEQPGAERVTTAALAARLDVSEAALYRHFASKAQMFEGLIDFHRAERLHAGEPDSRARGCNRPPAGRKNPHAAGAVRRAQPGHDARHGGRRAGVSRTSGSSSA
jgi:AcrR family transcriptional regulator